MQGEKLELPFMDNHPIPTPPLEKAKGPDDTHRGTDADQVLPMLMNGQARVAENA